jgi:hypothetical protein
VQPELFCPKCRIEVQPIKAAVHWYCPHCAWQFSDEDVWRQLNDSKQAEPPGRNRLPDPPEGNAN